MEAQTATPNFNDFLASWCSVISLSFVASRIEPFFEEYESADLLLGAVLHGYDTHPRFKEAFSVWVTSQRGENAKGSTFDGCIRMVGLKTAKHFLTACLLGERFPSKSLQLDPKTVMFPKPLSQTLAYSTLAQQKFSDGTRYHDTVYPLGLFFDFVQMYVELHAKVEVKKKLETFLKSRFELAVRASEAAITMMRTKERMIYEQEVLPLIFLECAAQGLFAIYAPEYPEFVSITEKKRLDPVLCSYAERLRFGTHHNHLGNASIPALPQFQKLSRAITHLHSPHQLQRSEDADIRDLVTVVSLSLSQERSV